MKHTTNDHVQHTPHFIQSLHLNWFGDDKCKHAVAACLDGFFSFFRMLVSGVVITGCSIPSCTGPQGGKVGIRFPLMESSRVENSREFVVSVFVCFSFRSYLPFGPM